MSPREPNRRGVLLGLAGAAVHPAGLAADAVDERLLYRLLAQPDGVVLLMRHASAPGGGDPPGFRLDDCATQRNLSDEGREQARRIGERLRALRPQGLSIAAVWHSQWCRARETAELLAVGVTRPQPLFNSFFDDPDGTREQRFATQARTLLAAWAGPGALLVVTHQVNITALSGVFPASGEMVAMRWGNSAGAEVLGRLVL
ncbi:histidine phosphatase family protein [Roseateles sp.]|uniref:histidine phosphatase family protein n=1 Tax=Roseateles sp. TaxID=1971397 RepID=UPI003BA84313